MRESTGSKPRLMGVWRPEPADNSVHTIHRPYHPSINSFLFLFCLSDGHGTCWKTPAAGVGRGAGLAAADLADAPGGPLSAGIPRGSDAGSGLHSAMHLS